MRRWSFAVGLRRSTPVVRLLVLTQLAFNLGFYLVLPYLSVHLAADLGFGAAVVGVVLGVRTFAQQGLFFVGGTLADRWGVRPVVLVGCVIRVLGFLGLALFYDVVGVVGATVLVGFAAALFSPAVESAIADEAGRSARAGGPTRVETFALLAVANQLGAFAGPLLGSVLLLVDFRIACLAAAGVFVVVIAAHLRWLPRTPGAQRGEPWLAGWREVLGNRLFVLFAVAMSGYLIAYNQLYLLLPLEVERAWGSQTVLGWFFALSSVMVVIGQVPITRVLARRSPARTITAGFVVIAASFTVVALFAPMHATGFAGLVPAAVFVALLTLGEMIVLPQARDLVPRLAGERRLGAYYGFMASVSGLGVLAGSAVLGVVVDATTGTHWATALPWITAAGFPGICTVVLLVVSSRLAHPDRGYPASART